MIKVLTGENTFLLSRELRRIVEAFEKEHGDMAIERLDAEEVSLERIREAIQSVPFLASKKLVVLRSPSAHKQLVADAEAILGVVPEETELLIIDPKPDKRTAYYKYLKKHAELVIYSDLDAPQLAGWLMQEAKLLGAELSRSDAQHLIARLGNSQQQLWGELQKLASYSSNITKSSIDLLTDKTPQSTVFDLLEAALAGNAKKALELYDEQRALKVDPQQILALLAWQLHVLAVVAAAGDRSADTIAADAKLSPFVVRKTVPIARAIGAAKVKQLVHDVLLLDVQLKSTSIDSDEAMRHLILSLNR